MNSSAGMKSLETIHVFVCMVILAPTLTFGIQYKLKPLLKDISNLHVLSYLIMALFVQLWTFHTSYSMHFFMGLAVNMYIVTYDQKNLMLMFLREVHHI